MSLTPPPRALVAALSPLHRAFVGRIVAAAEGFPGATGTSWFRTVGKNRLVGGAPRSQHLLGLGVDVVLPPGQAAAFANEIRDRGLVAIVTPTHVHIQAFEAGTLSALF